MLSVIYKHSTNICLKCFTRRVLGGNVCQSWLSLSYKMSECESNPNGFDSFPRIMLNSCWNGYFRGEVWNKGSQSTCFFHCKQNRICASGSSQYMPESV